MAGRRITVADFKEIERLLDLGRSDRAIARDLGVSRNTVKSIRLREMPSPEEKKALDDPPWVNQVEWTSVVAEIGLGYPLKFIWSERASQVTGYPNFWKRVYQKFPDLVEATVTLRDFNPGERIEVDYAGDKIDWIDRKTGEIFEAVVFVGILCFSQKIFAVATENMQSRNWLESHRKMFNFYGGVPAVVVPDCLKQGVIKCHRYDPDLNPSYTELATHYGLAINPARPSRPKDKGLVEGAVRILMRYFRWKSRTHTFFSLAEINRFLEVCIEEINEKTHTRFRVSRNQRFIEEKKYLKPLPPNPYEVAEWKKAKLHADCYVSVEANFYSAPHVHRGKELRVKITDTRVEIFLNLERIACHRRTRGHMGARIKDLSHFPENSKAFYEMTPQRLLSQAKYLSLSLFELLVDLFNQDVYGNLRRAQGLIRVAQKEENKIHVPAAIAQMQKIGKYRVQTFEELLKQERQRRPPDLSRQIERGPNPMIRHQQQKEILQ